MPLTTGDDDDADLGEDSLASPSASDAFFGVAVATAAAAGESRFASNGVTVISADGGTETTTGFVASGATFFITGFEAAAVDAVGGGGGRWNCDFWPWLCTALGCLPLAWLLLL